MGLGLRADMPCRQGLRTFFLHVGNFAAFCVEVEIYGSKVLLYAKRVDESVCFLLVMIFLCNFEQLNNQSNIWIRSNRSLWSWH